MRHIFDQYDQYENRLTHALISSLAEDEKLLREFIKWTTNTHISIKEKINISEQALPGEEDGDEKVATQRGIPDAWIFTDKGWVLLVESKISSGLRTSQLQGHLNTAIRRGFSNPKLLVISVDDSLNLPNGTFHKTWCDIYEWGMKHISKSEWAKKFTTYFEIAEAKMVQQSYLQEGTLTRFTGVPFDNERPYNYLEAKRLLKLRSAEKITSCFAEPLPADLLSLYHSSRLRITTPERSDD